MYLNSTYLIPNLFQLLAKATFLILFSASFSLNKHLFVRLIIYIYI